MMMYDTDICGFCMCLVRQMYVYPIVPDTPNLSHTKDAEICTYILGYRCMKLQALCARKGVWCGWWNGLRMCLRVGYRRHTHVCVLTRLLSFFWGASINTQSSSSCLLVVYGLISISGSVYGTRDGIPEMGSPSLPNVNLGDCARPINGVHTRWKLNVRT